MLIDRLEHGNNFFEMIEFRLERTLEDGSKRMGRYGVNVAKVREVIRMPEIEPLGSATNGIAGMFELRGVMIPAINLRAVLGDQPAPLPENGRLIVAEFSNKRAGFIVSQADRIRRVAWDEVQPPSGGAAGSMTGMVLLNEKEFLFVLDMEKIVGDLEKDSGLETSVETDEQLLFGPTGANETLLLVEDSPVIMNNAFKQLRRHKYQVICATNGQEAWEILQSKSGCINAIVSDVEMPQMDGLTLVKKLKADAKLKSIPVILHSSLAGDATVDAGRDVGAFGYAVKNDFSTLFKLLNEALGQKAA